MDAPITVDKEMGITHADFLRVIRRALAGRPHEIGDRRIRVAEDGRVLDITLSAEGERRIAGLGVPVTRVRLSFVGYGEAEVARTLAWFDCHFQRGGG